MAKLDATGGVYSIEWQITDLAYPFNSKYYICAGVTPYEVPYGVAELPEEGFYYDQVDAPESRTLKSTPIRTPAASPGTYTLYGYAQDASNGLYYPAGVVEDIKVVASNPDPIEATFTCTAAGTRGVTFTISNLYAGQYGYCCVWDSDYNTVWGEDDEEAYFGAEGGFDGQTKTVTLSSLLPGRRYRVNVIVYSGGESRFLSDDDGRAGPDNIRPIFNAYLPDGEPGKTSVTVDGSGMISGGQAMVYIVDDETNEEVWGAYVTGSAISLIGSSFSENFDNLSPGRLYRVGVEFSLTDRIGNQKKWRAMAEAEGSEVDVLYIRTRSNQLEPWEWWTTIADGEKVKLRAPEWNAFTAHINVVRVYKGLPEITAFTTAVGGQTRIGATICNQARAAIDDIDGHGELPDEAVMDKPLSAGFFNKLRDALNAVK